MSVTHPAAGFAPVSGTGFVTLHPHLAPFLLAVAIVAVSAMVSLAITGLPT